LSYRIKNIILKESFKNVAIELYNWTYDKIMGFVTTTITMPKEEKP
jgi:hypothetical protein